MLDFLFGVTGLALDALWCVNVAGVAMKPLIYAIGFEWIYKALYENPSRHIVYPLLRIVASSSCWANFSSWNGILRTAFWIVVVVALVRKIIDVVRDRALILRWGGSTALLRLSW